METVRIPDPGMEKSRVRDPESGIKQCVSGGSRTEPSWEIAVYDHGALDDNVNFISFNVKSSMLLLEIYSYIKIRTPEK